MRQERVRGEGEGEMCYTYPRQRSLAPMRSVNNFQSLLISTLGFYKLKL